MNFLTYNPIIEGIDLQIKSRGKIGNEPCKLDPFSISSSEYQVENTARSYLQSVQKHGYTNHLKTELIFLNSVEDEHKEWSFYFLVNFKGRNDPDGSIILIARYEDETEQKLIVEYQTLKESSKTHLKLINEINYHEAVSAYCFGQADLSCLCFYDFTQHPDFGQAVEMHILLNY